jgi:polyhydroxyalkanoate synthesis regulator phasin
VKNPAHRAGLLPCFLVRKPEKGGEKMDQNQIFKQMIDFNKTTFDNSFNALVMLQEQTEKMVHSFLEQATWLPEEGKKVLNDWVSAYKKGCEDFKKTVDENFQKVDDYFVSAGK